MFSSARNVVVSGSTLTHIEEVHVRGQSGFEKLHTMTTTGAMHNSGERFDPPKCYPGTRVAVIRDLLDWILEHASDRTAFMRWLYGPAGSGKSAIMQELAELCYEKGLLIASFFFSRTAPMRNDEKRLITTIAYQLGVAIPDTRPLIEEAVEKDLAFFEKSLQVQLELLVVGPLNRVYSSADKETNGLPYLIVIDGLDECSNHDMQRYILNTLLAAAMKCNFPLLILISSRPETYIKSTINSPSFEPSIGRTALDDCYLPTADIEVFLEGSIRGIKDSHPLRRYLSRDWPLRALITALVQKSSGQFIYAATVVKFISAPDARPDDRLDIVLGLSTQATQKGPFSELDALYSHIFFSLEDINTSLRIVSHLILSVSKWSNYVHSAPGIENFLALRNGSVALALNKLASVIEMPQSDSAPVRILHASLPDFLLDLRRSGKYFIDQAAAHADLASMCLRQFTHGTDPWQIGYAHDRLVGHYRHASPSRSLLNHLVSLDFHLVQKNLSESGARSSFFSAWDILISTLEEYLHCTRIVKSRDHPFFAAECRRNVEDFIRSQLENYRSTSPKLLALLAVYTVGPTAIYYQESFSFQCDNPGTTVTWVDYLLGFTHDLDLEIPLDMSSLNVRRLLYVSKSEDGDHPYLPFFEDILTGGDFAMTAIHLASSVRDYSGPVALDDAKQLDERLKLGQGGPERCKRIISYMRQEGYKYVLECLPRLLERAEANSELTLLFDNLVFPAPETHIETLLAGTLYAIAKYKERCDPRMKQASTRLLNMMRRFIL